MLWKVYKPATIGPNLKSLLVDLLLNVLNVPVCQNLIGKKIFASDIYFLYTDKTYWWIFVHMKIMRKFPKLNSSDFFPLTIDVKLNLVNLVLKGVKFKEPLCEFHLKFFTWNDIWTLTIFQVMALITWNSREKFHMENFAHV